MITLDVNEMGRLLLCVSMLSFWVGVFFAIVMIGNHRNYW